MATTAAQIIAKVRVEGMQAFTRQMKQGEQATSKMGMSLTPLSFVLKAVAAALVGSAVALGGFAMAASHAAADIESLQLGLKAVLGTSEAAGMEFKRLRDIARMPGLTLEDTVGGFLQLASAGMGIGEAERSLRAFGNALASVGAGKEELKGTLLALSQIANTEFLQGDELNQLRERLPQVSQILRQAFGTVDTEKLKAAGITSKMVLETLTTGLEKIPQVTGGAKNSFENFADSVKLGLASAGQAINNQLMPGLNSVAQFVDFLTDSGFLSSFGESIAQAGRQIINVFGGEDGVLRFATLFLAVMEKIPGVVSNTFQLIASFAKDVFSAITSVIDFIPNQVNKLLDMISDLTGARTVHVQTPGQMAGTFMNSILPSMLPTIFQPGMLDDINKRGDELFKKFKLYQKNGPGNVPSIGDVMGASQQTQFFSEPILNAIGGTERNTRRTADATEKILDINRNILGGGNLGAMGVTPVEFGRFSSGNAPKATIEFKGNYNSVGELLQDIAEQTYNQAFRSGLLAGRG